jgi:hypothetical protein
LIVPNYYSLLAECFSLAEIVNELLDRSFRFDIEMIQTLSFPIPEEEKRI